MIDIAKIQGRLLAKGYEIGAADGVAGPRTCTAILAFVALRPMGDLKALGAAAATHWPRFGLMDTPARLANFTGQAAHETGQFRFLVEIWGPTDAQRGYEGRADLGNVNPGDGYRYRGRGIFQLTGRANYRSAGNRLNLPLEAQPDMVAQPAVAMLTACDFWQTRGLSLLADRGLEDTITRRINGGTNGIDKRRALVARAKVLLA